MQPTEKQKQASRENGTQGGVKTPEGKAVSRENALKHGILSNFKTKYDTVSFDEIYADFEQEFSADTPSRRVLIEQLTMTYIRMLRCARFEADRLKEALNPPEYETKTEGIDLGFGVVKETLVLVKKNDKAPFSAQDLSTVLEISLRYEVQLHRRFQRLVTELSRTA